MSQDNRQDLIAELAGAFFPESKDEVDTSKYVVSKNALNCKALDLDMDVLEKTLSMIKFQESRIRNDMNKSNEVLLSHLCVARKCVLEIIAQKLAKNQEKDPSRFLIKK